MYVVDGDWVAERGMNEYKREREREREKKIGLHTILHNDDSKMMMPIDTHTTCIDV